MSASLPSSPFREVSTARPTSINRPKALEAALQCASCIGREAQERTLLRRGTASWTPSAFGRHQLQWKARGVHMQGCCQAVASRSFLTEDEKQHIQELDDRLSRRPLDLDPAGYFLIFLDGGSNEIVVQHFRNIINNRGFACDPQTGQVIPCDGTYKPKATKEFRSRSAKQLSVEIVEKEHEEGPLLSMLGHANYLGRELQKAEIALSQGKEYVQD